MTTTRARPLVEYLAQVPDSRGDRGKPQRLLMLSRQHWSIENRSHWVRDVTFDEDRSQVLCGQIAQVIASLRNAAISLMRRHAETTIAALCRRFAARSTAALALLGIITNIE